jgi:hypothetical protein
MKTEEEIIISKVNAGEREKEARWNISQKDHLPTWK